jgi:hypothetical protein
MRKTMTELIQLTDVEIDAVAGGNGITQSISIRATQTNTSSVTQTATATNSGRVTASATGTGSVAVAAGAAASNVAVVSQANAIFAANSLRFGWH